MEIAKVNYEGITSEFKSVTPNDHIYKILKNGYFYELKLLQKIKSLNLKGTFVDVGANIGNHSVFFAKHCNSTSVVSIEMNEQIFEVLKENLKGIEKVKTFNCGIADKKGFATSSEIPENNVGMTKLIDFEKGNIKLNTLDNLLKFTKDICLIKMDIESCEVKALNGMKKILEKHSPVICVELKDEQERKEFTQIISTCGYSTDGVNYAATPTYIFTK